MIEGISHVAIVVADLDKSVSFYRDLLGFSSSRFWELPNGMKIAFLARPGHDSGGRYEIELLSNPSAVPLPEGVDLANTIGFRHVALVVDDIDEMYACLRDKGIDFTGEPRIPGPNLPKICLMQDPDGTAIELVQFMT